MISPNAYLHEQAKLVVGVAPTVPSSVTADTVSLKNYQRAAIILTGTTGTNLTTGAITLIQAQDVANTGAKTADIDTAWANLDITASDTLVAFTPTNDSFASGTTTGKSFMYVIDVMPENLDIANGFDCFRIGIGNMTNQTIQATYILYGSRYASATPPAAITD